VRIDAAAGAVSGKEEEIVVDGVTRAEGDRLRAVLLTRRPARTTVQAEDDAAPEPPVAEEEFAHFDNRWLLYAPLVGGYLVLPLAAVGALFRLGDELPDSLKPDLPGPDAVDARVVVFAIAIAVVVLVVGAVVGAAVVNWGFRLTRRGGSLLAVRGLITRRHTELEIDRIRGVTLAEGLGMRLVRAARVSALVTGLGDAARRGQLLPLGPREEALALGHRLVEDPGPLQRHPAAARRRRLTRAITPGALVAVVGAVLTVTAGWWWVLLVGAVLALLGIPAGLGRYASLGSVAGATSFSVRSGWLSREQAVLQRRAVVGWSVQQSFFQRRAGLATVVACVGAGSGGYAALDLAADDVPRFAVAASEPWATTLNPVSQAPRPADRP
jgi:putative membrane protein